MKIDAEIRPFYKLTLVNRDMYRGCYDPSEDWNIVIYGETLQEIVDTAPAMMVSREIEVSRSYLEVVACVVYQSNIFEMTDESTKRARVVDDWSAAEPIALDEAPEEIRSKMKQMLDTRPDPSAFASQIVNTERFKTLLHEKKLREEEEKQEKARASRQDAEKREREMFEQLKQKYLK